MAELNYNPHHKTLIDSFLLHLPGISTSKVFGLPCYKIDDVIFATLWGEGIGLKLPEARIEELLKQPNFAPLPTLWTRQRATVCPNQPPRLPGLPTR